MFKNLMKFLGGDPNKKELDRLAEEAEKIAVLEPQYEALSNADLRVKTEEFKQRLAEGETLDDLLVEAFALVREASKRTIGLRHYDIQMIGGMTLHQGKIAEMRTGEGKTLVGTLPVYLNALTGKGVHVVTVNDYLARRDARWMAPIYNLLGLSVGVLQMSRQAGESIAFLVDLQKESSQEDQHQLRMVPRHEAYMADIVYGTNSEFGFDYLRDNLTMRLEDRVQRGHFYAIIDEVDNILIDEARTPLIISGPAQDESEWYVRTAQVVRQLNPEDYEVEEKDRTVTLTEVGEAHVEQLMEMALRDPERPEDITPEQARVLGYLEQGLRAQFLYRRNKDYLVQGGKVIIIDEFTGRLMPGRRWSEGLHQAVEAKEGVKVEPENVTYATITIQNYFRMYEKLAGMTGTAETEAEELYKIYKIDVLPIPSNLEFVANQPTTDLVALDAKDEEGYKYVYYTDKNDTQKHPLFWKRKDYPDQVYRSEEAKLRAITLEVFEYYVKGRPQLVGTTSVEHSERLSERFTAEPVRRMIQVLLIRLAYLKKNNLEFIERQAPELEPLNKPVPEINTAELRQLARSLGVSFNPEDAENLVVLKSYFGFEDGDISRLVQTLQGGIVHEVLNARKHDTESMIIAKAGAFGAVTIATNMAGRGVDIKLGGELHEDTLRDVNRVLARVVDDPFNLTNEDRLQALKNMDATEFGIYEEAVNHFLEYMKNMRRVRELGGLHVIGSERHEARRIDNQLRGRAARQGDPGSSRFYLSLEDDLMRLFGGQQVEMLWKRILFDESQPMEMGLLGRLVEQSQERVEGANFDIRKRLLEYDDVLNTQRARIYAQRDRVFTKEDLSEDVMEMLRLELQKRVPLALADEEGPWKLLAYLDEIQPTISYQDIFFPSYTLQLLFDEFRASLRGANDVQSVKNAVLDIAKRALEAEHQHVVRSTRSLIDRVEESIQTQLDERQDLLDTFLEGLDEEAQEPRRPQDVQQELTSLIKVPVRLSNQEARALLDGDENTAQLVREQIGRFVIGLNANRLVGAVERRLEESLELRAADLQNNEWREITNLVLDRVDEVFNRRLERLLGDDGQIARDIEPALKAYEGESLEDQQIIQLLNLMSEGTRLTFDARTHRKAQQRYTRVRTVFLAAGMLENIEPQEETEKVLKHMEEAVEVLEEARGLIVWNNLAMKSVSLSQLDERSRMVLSEAIGAERFEELAVLPLIEIGEDDREVIEETLGRRVQNESYRELLLRVISEQWVEYLTRVEALRVSVGLEAYAQRDPLVQYKSKATEMFQSLLEDVRHGVISRVFTFSPRQAISVSLTREQLEAAQAAQAASEQAAANDSQKQIGDGNQPSGKKKRRRH